MSALSSASAVTPVASLAAALLLVAAVLVVSDPRGRARRSVAVAAVVAVLAGAIATLALAGTLDVARTASAAAAASGGGVAIALLLPHRVGAVARSVCAGLGAALVIAPVAVVQMVAVPPLLESSLGAVDLAGAVPRLAAPAGVVVGALLVRPEREAAVARTAVGRIIAACVLGVASVAASVVAAEGRVDDATASILGAVVVGAVVGAAGWMLVVRIAGRAAHPADAVAGSVVGSAAVALAAVALVPVAVVAVGAAAGVVGGALRGARRPVRGTAVGVLAGLSAGGVVMALLAEGIGFAATGSLGQAGAQVAAVALVAISGVVVGAVCALEIPSKRRQTERPRG